MLQIKQEQVRFSQNLDFKEETFYATHQENKYVAKRYPLINKNFFNYYFVNINNMIQIDSKLISVPLNISKNQKQFTIYNVKYELSLYEDLLIRKHSKIYYSSKQIKQFLKSMFVSLIRMETNRFNSLNIKPTNIFYFQKQWIISQAGFISKNINRNYSAPQIPLGKNKSIFIFEQIIKQYELYKTSDIFSIGIILLQMCTLVSQYQLQIFNHKELNQSQKNKKDKLFQEVAAKYGIKLKQLIQIMTQIYPSKRPNINQLKRTHYSDIKNSQVQFNPGVQINHQAYLSPQIPENLQTDFGFGELFKNQLKQESKHFFEVVYRYDPKWKFKFQFLQTMINFFADLKVNINDQKLAVKIWKYYEYQGYFNYMHLLVKYIETKVWLKDLLKLTIKFCELSFHDFYLKLANKKKKIVTAQSIMGIWYQTFFLFNYKQLQQTIRLWSQGKQFIQEQQLKKVLYVQGQQELEIFKLPQQNKNIIVTQQNKKLTLEQFIKQLANLVLPSTLFQFFLKFDPNKKFVVENTINYQINNLMTKSKYKNYAQAMDQMWKIAGIDDNLKYLKMVKFSYPDLFSFFIDLFQFHIKEQKSFENHFAKFESGNEFYKYWDYRSFEKWNKQYFIELSTEQLRVIFDKIDNNKNNKISKQQLRQFIPLSQQFSLQTIIDLMKSKLKEHKIQPLFFFLKFDLNKDLFYDSNQELYNAMNALKIKISKKQCQIFYQLIQNNERRINLIKLSKNFQNSFSLFKNTLNYIIRNYGEYTFQSLFQMGDTQIEGKYQEKWKRVSINKINQDLGLGLDQNDLKQIWTNLNQMNQEFISKEEVQKILEIDQNVDFMEKEIERQKQEEQQRQVRRSSMKKIKDIENSVQKCNKKRKSILIQKSQLLQQKLRQYNKQHNMLSYFFEVDTEKELLLSKNNLKKSLGRQQIEFNDTQINALFQSNRRQIKFDYIKFLMFISQTPAEKFRITMDIIKQAMKKHQCKLDKIMGTINKGKWTKQHLSKFLQLLKLEIQFQDINLIWQQMDPENKGFITEEELQLLINNEISRERIDLQRKNQEKIKNTQSKQSLKNNKSLKKMKLIFDETVQSEFEITKLLQSQKLNEIKKNQKKGKIEPNIIQIQSQPFIQIPAEQKVEKSPSVDYQLSLQNLTNQVKKNGFHFDKYSKNHSHLSQKQFLSCLQQNYSIQKINAKILFKNFEYGNLVEINFLKEKFKIPIQIKSKIISQTMIRSRPLYGIRQAINGIVEIFLKNHQLNELIPFFFEGKQVINNINFKNKIKEIVPDMNQTTIDQIFKSCDPNRLDFINIITFKNSFLYTNIHLPKQQTIVFHQELEKQLKNIFMEADKNKTGLIEKKQLQYLITKMGINIGQKTIDDYFKEMDIDKSKTIDFNELKLFIQKNVFEEIYPVQQILDNLKQELQIADIFNRKKLSLEQFVFRKLNIKVQQQQFGKLFNQLDIEKQNLVDIKYFLKCLDKFNHLSNSSKIVIYKIRCGDYLNLKQIKRYFTQLPSCYSISFVYLTIKKKLNLPSSGIKPKLNQTHLFYNDISYYNIYNKQYKTNILAPNREPCLTKKIILKQAKGIPLPMTNISKIFKRKVACAIYDAQISKIIENICIVNAKWEQENQNYWIFTYQDSYIVNNQIFVKYGNYSSKDAFLLVIFQFIIITQIGKKLVEVNCGCASISLKQLLNNNVTSYQLPIEGGVPDKKIDIRKEFIQGRKSLWKSIFGGQYKPILFIEVKHEKNLQDQIELMNFLPSRIIFNSKALNIYRWFRQFFAVISLKNEDIDTNAHNNRQVKTFLRCIDCPEIFEKIIRLWNKSIIKRVSINTQYKKFLEIIIRQLEVVLRNKQFSYSENKPTYSPFLNINIMNARERLVNQALANTKAIILKQPIKIQHDPNLYRPLRIEPQYDLDIFEKQLIKMRGKEAR